VQEYLSQLNEYKHIIKRMSAMHSRQSQLVGGGSNESQHRQLKQQSNTEELLYPPVVTANLEQQERQRHMHAKSVSQSIVEKFLGASSGMSTLIYVGGGEGGGYPPQARSPPPQVEDNQLLKKEGELSHNLTSRAHNPNDDEDPIEFSSEVVLI
jgi:hypothetical protein